MDQNDPRLGFLAALAAASRPALPRFPRLFRVDPDGRLREVAVKVSSAPDDPSGPKATFRTSIDGCLHGEAIFPLEMAREMHERLIAAGFRKHVFVTRL